MELLDAIEDSFYKVFPDSAMRIGALPEEWPAWTVRDGRGISVAVPCPDDCEFHARFAAITMAADWCRIGSDSRHVLMLTCRDMRLRNPFAVVCRDFIEPGEDGRRRSGLVNEPAGWWEDWKDTLGNVSRNQSVHGVLGEMHVLAQLAGQGCRPVWNALTGGTRDIEVPGTFSVEVKSTLKRYGYCVEISSVFQLSGNALPLYLDLVRFERSAQGICINSMVDRLVQCGFDRSSLEEGLEDASLPRGAPQRRERYAVIEHKRYPVDDRFPLITEHSFKWDRIPRNVVHFTYAVDLSGVTGENLL